MNTLCAAILTAYVASAAFSAEEHEFQGVYAEAQLESKPLGIISVAQGNWTYELQFQHEGETYKIVAKAPEKNTAPVFEGRVGKYRVEGLIDSDSIECIFKRDGAEFEFDIARITRKSPTLGAMPPKGAIVLMDGSNLDEWETSPLKWSLHGNGDAEVANPDLISKREFGDHRLHLEFRTPFMPHARGQARGNSGVYLHGAYEVQVLDSFGLPPADNDCGGIYKIAVPSANMCLPPLEWQTYDITFRAARFDSSGKKTENARVSVDHNGVTIHDNIELPGLTGGAMRDTEVPLGPLKLQHHSDPVRYRNVWALPLD